MYDEFINKICSIYSYDDEVKKAISIAIPLMVNYYGEEQIESILEVFNSTKIYNVRKLDNRILEDIFQEQIGRNNRHVHEQKSDTSYDDTDIGSIYCSQPIFDDDVTISDEVKWIVVEDTKGTESESKYREMFGTSINIPYFLNSISHAFSMVNPIYEKKDNEIVTKKGMFESCESIKKLFVGYSLNMVSKRNSNLEEAFATIDTQSMLCDFFGEKSYAFVQDKLETIGYEEPNNDYFSMYVCNNFQNAIGRKNLIKYRKDNDVSIIERFNKFASKSEIASKYFPDEAAYDYMSRICSDMEKYTKEFSESCLSFEDIDDKYDEYQQKTNEMLCDAMAPIYAYKDSFGLHKVDAYENFRSNILDKKSDSTGSFKK